VGSRLHYKGRIFPCPSCFSKYRGKTFWTNVSRSLLLVGHLFIRLFYRSYTEEDDNHLVRYLARRIPDKSHGGRYGHKIYKDLAFRVFISFIYLRLHHDDFFPQTDLYPWSARHSWQSWLERYKKNADRLDPPIEAVVAGENINAYAKGVFPYKRYEVIYPTNRGRILDDVEEDEEMEEVEEEEEDEENQGEDEENQQEQEQEQESETNEARLTITSRSKVDAREAKRLSAPEVPRRAERSASSPHIADRTWPPVRKKRSTCIGKSAEQPVKLRLRQD
jgi:hypothetical protein